MVPSTETDKTYSCDGAQTQFGITFSFQFVSEIRVKLVAVDGSAIDLTPGSDFTVVGTTLTTTTTYQSPYKLFIYRVTEQTQKTDFIYGQAPKSEVVEMLGDHITRMVQEHAEGLSRAILLDRHSALADLRMDEPQEEHHPVYRDGRIGWMQHFYSGNYSLLPFMGAFLESADTAAARVALGAAESSHDHNSEYWLKTGDVILAATKFLSLLDKDSHQHKIGKSEYTTPRDGVTLRTIINPATGGAIFTVESSGFSPRLIVEHAGSVKTSNADYYAGVGTDGTGGNKVWHQGNDGAGSGLDADTVDGVHASAFADAVHGHRGHLYGLELSNNTVDANNDIDIAVGECVDDGADYLMELTAGLTKRLDAAWAVGNNAGGLDTGTKAVSTTYHVFIIRKDSDGTIDALFSLSATAPTIPVGWTAKRRIGAVLTDGSGNIRAFVQRGDRFRINVVVDYTGGSRALALLALTIPSGVSVTALLVVNLVTGNTMNSITLAPGDNSSLSQTYETILSTTAVMENCFSAQEQTDDGANIYMSAVNAAGKEVRTVGWIDRRGRDAA